MSKYNNETLRQANIKNIVYELFMGPPVYVKSLSEFCKFFSKRKKRIQTSYQRICQVVKRQRQAPMQEPVLWCKITYKTGNGGSIKRIGTDDFIFTSIILRSQSLGSQQSWL